MLAHNHDQNKIATEVAEREHRAHPFSALSLSLSLLVVDVSGANHNGRCHWCQPQQIAVSGAGFNTL